jgi:hypothetical protein
MTIESEMIIQQRFKYNDGILINKITNKKVGDNNGKGYLQVTVKGKRYYVHRVIFFLFHGRWPKDQIDHINKDKTDNRIENLRECSRSENHRNRADIKGRDLPRNVYIDKSTGRYRVQITINNKKISLGCYPNIELAQLVASEAREKYYGEFA